MKLEDNQELWLGVEQLNNDPALKSIANQEFIALPIVQEIAEEKITEAPASRRDFLKYLGFSVGAATIAASCDIPVRRALPYVVKPDQIVPGVATYYASSFVRGGDYCAVLVKTREGRPIKIEGNSLSPITKGGTNARAQASVLDLYDTSRLMAPYKVENGKFNKQEKLDWAVLDTEIKSKLSAGGDIVIISNTVLSPTTKAAIEEFKAKYPTTNHITYDPISSAAILEANQETFGQNVIPAYHFDKAEVIVSIGADFLGTWISPIEYAADYVKNRKIEKAKDAHMSRHIQVESHMSLTGSNADDRVVIRPSEQGAAIAVLYNEVATLAGGQRITAPVLEQKAADELKKYAKELYDFRGKSLVVSGSNNTGEQILVNAINDLLGNYGTTLDFNNASLQRQGSDRDISTLAGRINSGKVPSAVIILDDANPAFDLPSSVKFAEAMSKVNLKISFAGTFNETSALCDYLMPSHHYLESWGDVEAKRGIFSIVQPTIRPLFNTRQAEETLLVWADSPNYNVEADQPYYEYLKNNWLTNIFERQTRFNSQQIFWDNFLHDGVLETEVATIATAFSGNVADAASKINQPSKAELEIALFETVGIGAGQYANNPWLQEMPDPVTRCTWGNYLQIPIQWDGNWKFTGFKGLNNNEVYGEADIATIKANGVEASVTAIRTFGLKATTVAAALGYGRNIVGKSGENIGTNVQSWLTVDKNGNFRYYADAEYIGKAGEDKRLACVQYHHSIGLQEEEGGINIDEEAVTTVRRGFQGVLTNAVVIRRANLQDLERFVHGEHHDDDHGDDSGHHGSMKPFTVNYMGLKEERKHHQELNSYQLYPGHEDTFKLGHHWGMHVDLNACIGCGTCVVACMSENNIPVVGKTEVGRHHEMAWLRIDRYYYGDYETPNVVYQPLMCQHCDNAPCENVCPVAATPHSEEGLNQMAYNRCIGTRYCANNCPYKVRRFNWMDYTTADIFPANEPRVNGEEVPFGADNLTRMVLNPDVTVRSRGVIEKCSFCVQRIQAGKLTAKRENRRLRDADVRTACQTACPTGAITFGDRNDKNGELSKKWQNELNYIVLEQTNVRSSVEYTAKVVNKPYAKPVYAKKDDHKQDAHG